MRNNRIDYTPELVRYNRLRAAERRIRLGARHRSLTSKEREFIRAIQDELDALRPSLPPYKWDVGRKKYHCGTGTSVYAVRGGLPSLGR